MRSFSRIILALGGAGLAAAVACSHETMPTSAVGAVQASVTLQMRSTSPGPIASVLGPLADDRDDTSHGTPHQRISKADVDSLTVDVTKVEVLAETSDSAEAREDSARAAEAKEDSAEAAKPDSNDAKEDSAEAKSDTARREGGDHENDERTWVSLDVTGGGHINLLKLPDSASAGITFASGTLAAGTYKHVRLFVTNAKIYLHTQIVTPTSDTLKAGVALPVIIPSRDSTGAAIKTDERFTVPSGGGTIKLFFDADDTIRHIVVTGDGKIIVPAVIR